MRVDFEKKQLQEIIINISNMNKQELINYSQKVYISKDDIEEKAFKFIERALDLQMAGLCEITDISPIAVCSEIEED